MSNLKPALKAKISTGTTLTAAELDEVRQTVGNKPVTANQLAKVIAVELHPLIKRLDALEALGNVTRTANRALSNDLRQLGDLADQFLESN